VPSKGNPHVRIRVDPVLKRFLQGYALAHDTTTAKLVRDVLAEWAYERVDPTPSKRVDHTLHRLDLLSKQLQLKVAILPAKGEVVGSEFEVRPAGHVRIPGHETVQHDEDEKTEPPRVDTVKERESMYWIVVAMLKEAQKLSENEALAKNAGSRIDAMMVAGALARVGDAILAGYERAYIQPHLDELEKLIEQLKEQLKQTDQKGQENPSRSAAT
jgi:hypothetical protein